MKRISDILFLLTCFSLRAGYLQKAALYSAHAYGLFPNDHRIVEVRTYALLLQGLYDEAEDILRNFEISNKNLAFLRIRTSILLSMSESEKKDRIRKYLSAKMEAKNS